METRKKAANLYELCEEVCENIAASPLHYYQDDWKTSVSVLCKEHELVLAPGEACGTAYCRAGHMHVIMKQDHPETLRTLKLPNSIFPSMNDLLQKAGISGHDISMLFGGTSWGDFGTGEYANRGVKGMREFMAKNEEKLKKVVLS